MRNGAVSPIGLIRAAAWLLAAGFAVSSTPALSQQATGNPAAVAQCAAYYALPPRDRAQADPQLAAFCGARSGVRSGSALNPGLAGSLYDPGQQNRPTKPERYVPTIWVDPDGCQHWVMDDGWEGYMTPNVTRDGIPVCNRGNACYVENTDTLFATASARLTAAGRRKLAQFFRSSPAFAFIIEGHTDNRGSDEYNMALSLRRAKAVAEVAQSVGARVIAVRGYGEREPRASNRSASGRRLNRRVEVQCVR
ncbi:MAG: OmpA family protein [Alphaproteobacteria bacterium]|nr:MAG: OmpA family protein [Alphaproteobacteria bacterium]